MRMPPESPAHTFGGILMNTLLTFRSNVKMITESPSEIEIVYARLRPLPSPDPSVMEPPTMTGKSGKTHGASAVSTPAINEMRKRIMCALYLTTKNDRKCREITGEMK